ncbi:MAG TPA: anhydro-N-acetylmuramic acid kinase, partial [Gemmatimonadales bacterium]
PAVIAERLGVTVVSDFRSRDVAGGGQGAPLVPMADAMLFGNPDGPRALLNIGGMANITFVPRRGSLDGVMAFDTGPGVAVIDAVVRAIDPAAPFDQQGARATRGRAVSPVVDRLLGHAFFSERPPKSTGREAFGAPLADDLVRSVRTASGGDDDCVATAVALTARSIAEQSTRWLPGPIGEMVMSGGGTRNPALVAALTSLLPGVRLVSFDQLFFDGDAKEAVAFAYLGHLTLQGRAGNVPSATGARGPRVLGRITPA